MNFPDLPLEDGRSRAESLGIWSSWVSDALWAAVSVVAAT